MSRREARAREVLGNRDSDGHAQVLPKGTFEVPDAFAIVPMFGSLFQCALEAADHPLQESDEGGVEVAVPVWWPPLARRQGLTA